MKRFTLESCFLLILILSLLIGCGSRSKSEDIPKVDDKKSEEVSLESSSKLNINLNVLNKEGEDEVDPYYVYFVVPGKKQEDLGKATQSGKSKPYLTDNKGTLVIDISEDYDLQYLISDPESSREFSLELYVTSLEDIYIRNPLNQKTVIDFDVLKDEDSDFIYDYKFLTPNLDLDIVDKYPDGVLSLTFTDAVFVVKLNFDPPSTKTAYEVSLYLPSDKSENGIGYTRIGRLAKEFQYWDSQFYANEVTGTRAVVISDTDTNEIIEYEGYPLWLDFNDDGTCKDGDIINIKMPPGS